MRDKGAGTVYKKDGKFIARLRWTDEFGPHEKTFKAHTKAEASRRMKAFKADLVKGEIVAGREITLGEWLGEAMESIYKPKVRPSTYYHYEQLTRNHLKKLSKVKLTSLTVEMIESILRDESIGGRTREHLRRFLIGALNHAVRRGKLVRNPAQLTMPVRFKVKTVGPVSMETARAIVENTYSPVAAAAIETMVLLGLRVGEVLGIRWSDIEEGVVTIERQIQRCRLTKKLVAVPCKTDKSRRDLPMNSGLIDKLTQLPIRGEYVFGTESGAPMDPRNLQRAIDAACKRAKIPHVSCHQLRHSFATAAVDAGVPINVISAAMGHSQIAVTLRYAKTRTAVIKSATDAVAGLWAK